MTETLNGQLPPAAIVVVFNNAIVLVAAVVVRLFVPPHTENVPSATDRPNGKTSVKATPLKAVDVFGLSRLKLRVVVFPVKMGFAVNDLAIIGGSITVRLDWPKPTFAVVLVFGPVSVEEILLLVFVYEPAAAPVTVTLNTQVPPLAASVPPESEMVLGEVRVKVPVVQTVAVPDVTVNPAGKTSVKETPFKDVVALGFVSVNVSVLVLSVPMDVGEKLLERVGTVGRAQPVNVTSSRCTSAFVFCAPTALIRNVVVLVPVVGAEKVIPYVPAVVVCQDPFDVENAVLELKVPESAWV